VSAGLTGWANVCLVTGLGFYAYGSVRHRLPHAPIPFNGPRGWPWQHRDWFTRRGRVYRNVGLVFEGLALGFIVASWVSVA
jgi:hypothetical protein